jgi:hypothetical protein
MVDGPMARKGAWRDAAARRRAARQRWRERQQRRETPWDSPAGRSRYSPVLRPLAAAIVAAYGPAQVESTPIDGLMVCPHAVVSSFRLTRVPDAGRVYPPEAYDPLLTASRNPR